METNKELIASLEATRKQIDVQIEQLKKQSTKPKFEVCKWYKTYLGSIYFITKKEEDELFGYGVDANNDWFDECNICELSNIKQPATESEVFEALKKEAIKRGFVKGAKVKPLYRREGANDCGFISDGIFIFQFKDNEIVTSIHGNTYNSAIFKNGKWAKIIKEEPIKIGGYEVKKNENGSYDIGCKKQISNGKVKVLRRLMIQCEFKKVSFDGIETDLETIEKILEL